MLQLISSPNIISLSGNPITYTFAITPYKTAERNTDLRIIVNVEHEEIYNSGVFEPVREQSIQPENNGCASIDIRRIVQSYLSYELPRMNQEIPTPLTHQSHRFRITYKLLRNGEVAAGTLATSAAFTAVLGGLGYTNGWSSKKFFDEHLAVYKTFLRYPSKREYIFRDDPAFLTWISALDRTYDQTVYLRLGYADGTTSDPITVGVINADPWQPAITPAGYAQLAIDAKRDTDKDLVWYELSVEAEEAPEVCVAVYIRPLALPDAVKDVAYSFDIPLQGTQPFSIDSSTLPAWMSATIDTDHISLTGTPLADGTDTVTITVTNCSGDADTYSAGITILSTPPSPTTFPYTITMTNNDDSFDFSLIAVGAGRTTTVYSGKYTSDPLTGTAEVPSGGEAVVYILNVYDGHTLRSAVLNELAAPVNGAFTHWSGITESELELEFTTD